jgi:ABC-type hemin transport system substrate-binding protein
MNFRRKKISKDRYGPDYAKDVRHLADLVRRRHRGEDVEQQYQQALQKFLRESRERHED